MLSDRGEGQAVVHDRGVAEGGACGDDPIGQAIEEELSIGSPTRNPPSFDPVHDHVMEGAGEIQARSARNTYRVQLRIDYCQLACHNDR